MTTAELSPIMQRQYELEREMVRDGVDRYFREVANAKAKGREHTTRYGVNIMRTLIEPLARQIEEWREKALYGTPGRRASAAVVLEDQNASVLAYIVVKQTISKMSLHNGVKFLSLAVQIGRAAEDEARFDFYSRENGALYNGILRQLKDRTMHEGYQRGHMIRAMRKYGYEFEGWGRATRVHVGTALVHCLVEATGLWQLAHVREGRRTTGMLTPKEELVALVSQMEEQCAILAPSKFPMIVEPAPWEGPYGGGYHFLPDPLPLITGFTDNRQMRAVEKADMSSVYEAVNAIQSTPWRVNRGVLDVANTLWARNTDQPFAGLPAPRQLEIPPKPADVSENEEARSAWRREAAATYRANYASTTKRVSVNSTLYTATRFADEEAIYFPQQLCFRGRIYSSAPHLSPQGHDLSKGLLQFAEGKPINDDRALEWLMIHGANVFGEDKRSMDARLDWVEENEERILQVGDDPLSDLWWQHADKPFQFLAFCLDYTSFQREGWGYLSHLPIALDGSCNGLQHYSAMVRDREGGKAVNLVPAEEPADVYQLVADLTMDKLREMPVEVEHRAKWLELGVSRKLTKRPVMIVPYSGTRHAATKYTARYITDELPAHFGGEKEVFHAALCVTGAMWKAIDETVVSARKAMQFLTKTARSVAKSGNPMTWTTPDGFPVLQAYTVMEHRKVKTRMGGSLVYLTMREASKNQTIDVKAQCSAVAPNFVHSLDGTALRSYVLLARDNGINSFSMVHDSFGTHAADTEMSAACLRHAFVNMYSDHNVLEDFRAEAMEQVDEEHAEDVPNVPEFGDLDIAEVRHSPYFFA